DQNSRICLCRRTTPSSASPTSPSPGRGSTGSRQCRCATACGRRSPISTNCCRVQRRGRRDLPWLQLLSECGRGNGRDVELIFVTRSSPPALPPTSQMLPAPAFALSEQGQAVCVITSRQRYDAPAERLPARETVKGVSVRRLWTSRFGRANLLGRAIDYATFYAAAAWRLWWLARPGDVVIAKTDPPMLSLI